MAVLEKTTTNETCDRCGPAVKATHVASLGSLVLTFCNHHTNEHHAVLLASGFDLDMIDSDL